MIFQEDPAGCTLAVLANLAEKPYREIATRAVAISGLPHWLNNFTWINSKEQQRRNEALQQISIENNLPSKIGFHFSPFLKLSESRVHWNCRERDFTIYPLPKNFTGFVTVSGFNSVDSFPLYSHALLAKNGGLFDPQKFNHHLQIDYNDFPDGESQEQLANRYKSQIGVSLRFDSYSGIDDKYYFPTVNWNKEGQGKPFQGKEIEVEYYAHEP